MAIPPMPAWPGMASWPMPDGEVPVAAMSRIWASVSAQAATVSTARVASTATVARALRLGGASTARIVRPGQAIAMDYETDRLTIEVDAKNRILRLSCG